MRDSVGGLCALSVSNHRQNTKTLTQHQTKWPRRPRRNPPRSVATTRPRREPRPLETRESRSQSDPPRPRPRLSRRLGRGRGPPRPPAARAGETAVRKKSIATDPTRLRPWAPAQAPKKGDEKKKKKKSKESYSSYIYKVLKQVHPDTGISKKGMVVMCGFIQDIFERLERRV